MHRFGNVRAPTERYDLKLLLQPPVTEAIQEALGSLQELCIEMLGVDAELFELAVLVSDPGAKNQRVHPDTQYSESPVVLSAFIALQDIDETMGPTTYLPRTHNLEAHTALRTYSSVPDQLRSFIELESLGPISEGATEIVPRDQLLQVWCGHSFLDLVSFI